MAILVHTCVLMGLFMAFGGDTREVGYARLLGIAFVFGLVAMFSVGALGPWLGTLAIIPAQAVMVFLLMQFCYIAFRSAVWVASTFSVYLVIFGMLTRT